MSGPLMRSLAGWLRSGDPGVRAAPGRDDVGGRRSRADSHRQRRRLLLRAAGRLWSPAGPALEGDAHRPRRRVSAPLRDVRRAHRQAARRPAGRGRAHLPGRDRGRSGLREEVAEPIDRRAFDWLHELSPRRRGRPRRRVELARRYLTVKQAVLLPLWVSGFVTVTVRAVRLALLAMLTVTERSPALTHDTFATVMLPPPNVTCAPLWKLVPSTWRTTCRLC